MTRNIARALTTFLVLASLVNLAEASSKKMKLLSASEARTRWEAQHKSSPTQKPNNESKRLKLDEETSIIVISDYTPTESKTYEDYAFGIAYRDNLPHITGVTHQGKRIEYTEELHNQLYVHFDDDLKKIINACKIEDTE